MAKLISIFFAAVLTSSLAYASGGGGGGGGGYGGGFSSGGSAPAREIDQNFEYGKSLFKGNAGNFEKVDYCIVADGEPQKVRSRSLRDFKGSSSNDLAAALVNCEDTEKALLDYMDANSAIYVLYYLNKRYSLNLSS